MKSMMWKSTFREIKQSLGRFLAILAIVALGVGFFSGLKVTRSAMVATTQDYLERKQFFDYRIMTTLGLDEEEIGLLAARDGVRAAEGAYTYDILCVDNGGSEFVLRAHSLTESVNGVELTAGRLPEAPDECVVDNNFYGVSQIGQSICLSEGNDESDKQNFTYEEYKIVGLAQSSLYIQFERGNTSLGNGRVSGFFYLLPEGFSSDYYTEAYVKFDQDYDLYSDEYDAFMEGKEAEWEALLNEIAAGRYDKVQLLSKDKLADARKELADAKAEGEKELAEAFWELEDARLKIEDGEREIEDGKREIADARTTLEEKEKELLEGEESVKREEKRITDGEEALAKNIADWEAQNTQVESALAELKTQQSQLDAQRASLVSQQMMLELAKLQMGNSAELEEGSKKLAEGFAMIASYQAQIDEGKRTLEDAQAQLKAGWEQIESAQKQLADGRVLIARTKADLTEGRRQIKDGWKEVEEAEADLIKGEKELAEGRLEYEDGLKEYNEAYEEFQQEIADAEEKIADARRAISEMEPAEGYLLERNTNVGYVCFESDSSIVDGIANIFPIFFFAVAALVCITTMNRMVEEQRIQIGVLKALGYSEGRIMGKYLFYSGLAAVIGCVLGFFSGTWLFPQVIWTAYGLMYRADTLLYVFDLKLALISLLVSCICSIGTTWLSCRYELSEVAAELMRPKAPKAGKRVLLEHVNFIWKRMKFLYKVSYRNIFRYKKRFFMMIIGISGCTALLVTGFGIKDSIANVAHDQYQLIQTFDISVTFGEAVDEDLEQELVKTLGDRAEGYAIVLEKSMDMVAGDHIKSINLLAMNGTIDHSPYLSLHTSDGETLAMPGPGECILNESLADDYDISVGDTIILKEDEMRSMKLVVAGLNENFIYNYAYITTQTYEALMGEAAQCKTAYVNTLEGVDAHLLSTSLMRMSDVVNVTVNADTEERLSSMMRSLDLIVIVVIICAAGLAFIVLYNLTNINITERIREIATIKVLGFYKKETESYVFRENIVLTLLGALLGLLLGYFLHQFVMHEIKVDMVTFQIHIMPVSYLYSVVLTYAFSWFVNRIMGKKLDTVSMTESLKSVD